MQARLAAALVPDLSRPETAWTLVKAMLSSDAGMVPDPSAETLTVRLLHQAPRGHDLALAPLLEELSRTRTPDPGTYLRLVCEILPNDPDARGGSAGAVDSVRAMRLRRRRGRRYRTACGSGMRTFLRRWRGRSWWSGAAAG